MQIIKNITPIKCVVREHWDFAARTGQIFATIFIGNQVWAILLWDGEDDPDLYKDAGLDYDRL